jgi:hypothetical protein
VTLAALIAAYQDSADEGDGLRATLPLAGRTLLERQSRLAASAGARPIVVVADRQPRDLLAAVDRLRAEGLEVILALSPAEAAKALQSDDRILLIGDGILADDGDVARLIAADGPALLTVPDIRYDDRFERIDAESRWAGLGLITGELLKRTVAMLQDWDLQSTLLRLAVQGGARQLAIGGDPPGLHLLAARGSADLAELHGRMLEHSGGHQRDWASRYLLAPLEVLATRRLMPTAATPNQLWLASLGLGAISALAFSRGWLLTGLLLFLLSTPLGGIAERLGRLRMDGGPRSDGWLSRVHPMIAAAALLALAYALSPERGWGTIVLAVSAIAFLIALDGEMRREPPESGIFLAEPKGMAWLLLPFAAAGQWVTGLAALALYAAGSFFWVQRFEHRGKEPGHQN